MSPSIDLTPQSTQILNSISGLAGGIAQGVEAGAQISAQRARDALLAQVQAVHMQSVQEEMARAQRQEALANQQRSAAQDAIGILTDQSGLPPTVAGVLRRMDPQHAAVALQAFKTEGFRRTLQGQIEAAVANPLGVTADIQPDGTPKPNPERQQQFKQWAEDLKNGADPNEIAQQFHTIAGEEIGKRSQSNVLNFHVDAWSKRLAGAVANGIDPHEGSTLLEAAKADPSYFEDPAHKHAFDVAVTTGNAIASDGTEHPPRQLPQYEAMLSENAALKQHLLQMEAEKNAAEAEKARAEAAAAPDKAKADLLNAQRKRGPASGTVSPSPSPEALYQQSWKAAAENAGSDAWGKMTDEQKHAETLKVMGRIRSAKAGFAAMDENAQAQGGEPTLEQQGASQALEKTRLASPELRLADYKAHPEKYGWIGGDPAKLKAWVEQGKQ